MAGLARRDHRRGRAAGALGAGRRWGRSRGAASHRPRARRLRAARRRCRRRHSSRRRCGEGRGGRESPGRSRLRARRPRASSLARTDRRRLEQRQAGEVALEPLCLGGDDPLPGEHEPHGSPFPAACGVPDQLGHPLRVASRPTRPAARRPQPARRALRQRAEAAARAACCSRTRRRTRAPRKTAAASRAARSSGREMTECPRPRRPHRARVNLASQVGAARVQASSPVPTQAPFHVALVLHGARRCARGRALQLATVADPGGRDPEPPPARCTRPLAATPVPA